MQRKTTPCNKYKAGFVFWHGVCIVFIVINQKPRGIKMKKVIALVIFLVWVGHGVVGAGTNAINNHAAKIAAVGFFHTLKNQKRAGDKMNGYKAFYKSKTIEVFANSSYEAQKEAAKQFKAKKSYEVTVILCEKQGEQVTHSTASI